jgi:hypothetical protein
MPALDNCHQQVVNALQKAGWSVDPTPFFIRTDEMSIFIDIQAEHINGKAQQIIVVEAK